MKSVLQGFSQVRNFFDNGCFDDGWYRIFADNFAELMIALEGVY